MVGQHRRSMLGAAAAIVVVGLALMAASIAFAHRASDRAPALRVHGKSLKWTRVPGVSRYVLAIIRRPSTKRSTTYKVVSGTSFTPPRVSGQTVGYRIRSDQRAARWSKVVSITYASVAHTSKGSPIARPVLIVSAGKIYWSTVSGATAYAGSTSNLPRGTPGRSTSVQNLGNVTSWSPPAKPGQTVYYGVASIGPGGGQWSIHDVAITWPVSAGAGPMAVGMNAQDYGGVAEFGPSGGLTVAQDIGSSFTAGRWDTDSDSSDFPTYYQSNGIKWDIDFSGPYNTGGVSALNPTSWAANAVSWYQTYCGGNASVCPSIEVLNEPYGSWFWGSNADDQQNAVAYGQLVEDTYTAFHAKYGASSPKILAYAFLGCGNGSALGCSDSWSNWIASAFPSIGNYYDGNIVHAYGGGSGYSAALSAEGNRNEITSAFAATGKLQYITEIGWPTDAGAADTDDSQQWTETQQADNIYSFVNWARGTGYVAGVWYFAYFDDGTPGWYGLDRFNENGAGSSHKPGWTALTEAADQQACTVC